jgi:phosphatidylglycerophosphate synthase
MLAAAVLAVSCLTDLVDGKIARKFNLISTV